MRLVTFEFEKEERLGAFVDDKVLDIAASGSTATQAFTSMQALIDSGPEAWDAARDIVAQARPDKMRDCADCRILAPLPRPVRIRDCSLMLEHMDRVLEQMARHDAEGEADPEAAFTRLLASGNYDLNPAYRNQCIYYNADHTSVSGTDVAIVWPSYSDYIDFELEWACVIGQAATDASPDRARDNIFGFTILNDWSARDVQLPLMKTMLGPGEGKDFPGSWGLGPCIATPDEMEDPYNLVMTAKVNGEEWTRGNTGSMYHRFEDAIAQFSREKTVFPGEILGSGTVLGGCGFELGRRLEAGDTVELEVQNIGILRNTVIRSDAVSTNIKD
jgi:2-keto-4-pentenoate hydratase/2-oxohepta-3-ene-1,7-dioic acid hydratase in catechol pathway